MPRRLRPSQRADLVDSRSRPNHTARIHPAPALRSRPVRSRAPAWLARAERRGDSPCVDVSQGLAKSAGRVLSFYCQMPPKNDPSLLLRETAREHIRSGKLPTRTPISTWGGSGNGARCAVCDETLSRDEWEVEFEAPARDGQKRDAYRMHVSCYAAWESEVLAGSARGVCSEATKSGLGPDAIHESEASIGRSG